jgi:hypothetical protein
VCHHRSQQEEKTMMPLAKAQKKMGISRPAGASDWKLLFFLFLAGISIHISTSMWVI